MSHKTCPYKKLPDESYWKRCVAEIEPQNVNPFLPKSAFKLNKQMIIATAGSCFAQHIARFLRMSGYNYLIQEKAPAFFPEELHGEYNYGTYSARYCNIYTTRQLVQLFDRAYGFFKPIENAWDNGSYVQDPFRPFVQPNGFVSVDELEADRERHFAAVRRVFEDSDVFVFTLGLTESWRDKRDGSIYPVAPGCGAGIFEKKDYEFHNLSTSEVINDLNTFLRKLFRVNRKVKVILTVSPVPLIATMSGDHVLAANTYSKSVLRAAAGEVANGNDRVVYFPSYEIITSVPSRGAYYMPDCRSVREEGVRHVMRVFFESFTGKIPEEFITGVSSDAAKISKDNVANDMTAAVDAICEEDISLSNVN